MPSYRVVWEIDLDAETPEDAARKALAIHRDPGSTATFFTVTSPDGAAKDIDLMMDEFTI